jgi:hypothetical protein
MILHCLTLRRGAGSDGGTAKLRTGPCVPKCQRRGGGTIANVRCKGTCSAERLHGKSSVSYQGNLVEAERMLQPASA